MLVLIPMAMNVPINHYKFEGDVPHVQDFYMTFGTLIESNAMSIIVCMMNGEQCFHRAMVAELSDTDFHNTAVMSFNPRRYLKIREQLSREFLCEWNGGARLIEYRCNMGEDYAGDDTEADITVPASVALSPLATIFSAMGFVILVPENEQPVADESSDLTGAPKETNVIDSSVFSEYLSSKEWKH